MVAFLAALPAIFAAMSSASDLFDVGKKVVREITGQKSEASTTQELLEEIDEMPPEKAQRFVERMKMEIEEFEMMSKRLLVQGGEVDAATLNVIPSDQRGQIAWMRMTTRPWAVRWMVYAVVLPPLSSVGFNLMISLYNALNKVWATQSKAIEHIILGDVFNDLYVTMVGWATGVIMTYMGMREIGKAVGHEDNVKISDVSQSISSFFQNVKKTFN